MPAGKTARRSHRVLVVDDDRDIASTFAELLRAMGHEAAYVCDSAQALSTAMTFLPDIALIDLAMPKVDGYTVAQTLKAAPALAGIRLVAVTGHDGEAERKRARQAGFDAHVAKPADFALLEAILHQFDR